MAYPWEKAIKEDVDYAAISSTKQKNELFWQKYDKKIPSLTNEFKDLVNSTVQNRRKRASLADVLGSKWMREPTLTEKEFQNHCLKYFIDARAAKDKILKGKGVDYEIPTAYNRNRRGNGIEFNDEWFESHQFKPLPEIDDFSVKTSFITKGDPLNIID